MAAEPTKTASEDGASQGSPMFVAVRAGGHEGSVCASEAAGMGVHDEHEAEREELAALRAEVAGMRVLR
jgi:hypothetical protein